MAKVKQEPLEQEPALSALPEDDPDVRLPYRLRLDAEAEAARLQKKEEEDAKPKAESKPVRIKKSEASALDIELFEARTNGVPDYTPDPPLTQAQMDAVFDRDFISETYGGNTQDTCPRIRKEKLLEHGMNDWLLLNLEMNPRAPKNVGLAGLCADPFTESQENTPRGPYRYFGRLGSRRWKYMGQYIMEPAEPFTVEEWRRQNAAFHNKWLEQICEHNWGSRLRAHVVLRQQLGRPPTKEEIDDSLDEKRSFRAIAQDEARKAFENGWLVFCPSVMKCIGYEHHFVDEMLAKMVPWIPKADRPKVAKEVKVKKGKKGVPLKKAKRKRVEESDDSDSEEVAYRARGTKTRPRRG